MAETCIKEEGKKTAIERKENIAFPSVSFAASWFEHKHTGLQDL